MWKFGEGGVWSACPRCQCVRCRIEKSCLTSFACRWWVKRRHILEDVAWYKPKTMASVSLFVSFFRLAESPVFDVWLSLVFALAHLPLFSFSCSISLPPSPFPSSSLSTVLFLFLISNSRCLHGAISWKSTARNLFLFMCAYRNSVFLYCFSPFV